MVDKNSLSYNYILAFHSNGSHLGWRIRLLDKILKGDNLWYITAKIGLI
jgi:hypothetical protein